MKFREITEETKQQYREEVNQAATNFDDAVKAVNKVLLEYGVTHFKMAQNILTVDHATTQKNELKVKVKNIAVDSYDAAIENLKAIRERYLKEFMPDVTPVTDPAQLMIIERELQVMTDDELLAFYNENYADSNLCRLCVVEQKQRKGHKEGAAYVEFPEFAPQDAIMNQIDENIKKLVGCRSAASSMFIVTAVAGDIKMIPWNTVFHEVEKRNNQSSVTVTLQDFVQKHLGM